MSKKLCSDCGNPLGNGNRSGRCKDCVFSAKHPPPSEAERAATIAAIRQGHGLRDYSDQEERALRGLVTDKG